MDIPFVIIGGQRCSTGWLSRCIGEHPEIFVAGDELRLFERNYDSESDWLSAIKHFPGYQGQQVVGEKTANYLTEPEAADRIYRQLPRMKMIAIFRDPVTRMISQFRMSRQQTGPLCLADLQRDPAFWENAVNRGRYSVHLKRFYSYFPSEQLKLLVYEDRNEKAREILQDVFQFLGVEPSFEPKSTFLRTKPSSIESSRSIKGKISRVALSRSSPVRKFYSRLFPLPVETVDPQLISVCRDLLGGDVFELEKLLGRDLKHWLCHKDGEVW